MATKFHSQSELRQQGMVGVYAYVEEAEEDRAQKFDDYINGKTTHLGEL